MSFAIKDHDNFVRRHIGSPDEYILEMLKCLGLETLDELIEKTIPKSILSGNSLEIGSGLSEPALIDVLQTLAAKNKVYRSYIGMGYHGTITPPVILRNVLENPGWYTQYTPYQAEISQGRLEALLNFQTMISDLTGLALANASLLDEATAAAEAMSMFFNSTQDPKRNRFFASDQCHPQTLDVLKTRSEPLGIKLVIGNHVGFEFTDRVFGALVQYPASDGAIYDYRDFCRQGHEAGAYIAVAADLLSLTLLVPPGEFGADVAVGSTQRFGIPMSYGGPHAAYMAAGETFKRKLPGRLIGVSIDVHGNRALRMALQTREQHIRRERATSNICTAQVLLGIMAGMYAVYHGPKGIKAIAAKVHDLTKLFADLLTTAGHHLIHDQFFDTLRVRPQDSLTNVLKQRAEAQKINLRYFEDRSVGISLDETVTLKDLDELGKVFGIQSETVRKVAADLESGYGGILKRNSDYLAHPVFNQYHSETEMLRYLHRLETKDLSLNTSMIPLGSCTMKLNAVTEMLSITWPEFSHIHPFAPTEQAQGYTFLMDELSKWLCNITGLSACSMQPNSGAQGEYTGLLTIRAYHRDRGERRRKVCLIPASAHGTNPASAVMAGMEVVIVKCDDTGNIDVEDLQLKAETHADRLAAIMVTYPSTHGVFEEAIEEICRIVHQHGGQVYLDGANLNAMVGLAKPGEFGADVCHINLHKTFAIPHGGGGPGMGPICVAKHLSAYLPNHSIITTGGEKGISAVSAAPFGSAGILPISWAYIALLGSDGLTMSTQVAILNANYMAKQLEDHFPILYRGKNGLNAHEFIVDLRPLKKASGVTEEDVAKRLMDYGFHAPTMSFPVPGTLMIEPTESESKAEMDRFCAALISIKGEIQAIERGDADARDNVLKNAPHTAAEVTADDWDHPYSRELAAYPAPWLKEHKYWPPVGRVNNAFGDRNLVCTCPPIEDNE